MRRSVPVLSVVGVAAGFMLSGCGSFGSSGSAVTAPAGLTPVPTAAVPVVTTGARTYQGPSADMQWGPVQVTLIVQGKRITDLQATAPTERSQSAFINGQAIPMLRSEVLQAKTVANIKNIYGISGATLTSEAFYQSLLGAMAQAKLS
ncbi:MAG TPA: FMN-binding protein [Chloroflexota bacterium]|nr:FMN-binding protein [Chloroflexota bacterium]